jgi:DNA-binding beta-propeller fold protein YncE
MNSAFDVQRHWLSLPEHINLGEVVDVAVDSADRVYLFNRGQVPVIVVDRDGNFLMGWGEGVFLKPHAIDIGPDDRVYCTDYMDHTVRVFSGDGKPVMTLGTPQVGSGFLSGKPFNQCTHSTVGPDGSIYVADGYGNARIHKFDPEGRLLLSWGDPGADAGQFIIPHNIGCDGDGMIYVADRENHRVQIFDANGRFEGQWPCYRAQGLFVSRSRDLCIVAEDCPSSQAPRGWPNVGSRVIITDRAGRIIHKIGAERPGHQGQAFIAPHGVAVNSFGDIFIADLSTSTWSRFYPDQPVPSDLTTVYKIAAVFGAVLPLRMKC